MGFGGAGWGGDVLSLIVVETLPVLLLPAFDISVRWRLVEVPLPRGRGGYRTRVEAVLKQAVSARIFEIGDVGDAHHD